MSIREGQLVLRDGSVFEGELIGAVSAGGVSSGEVVFHTGLTGYQEVISDPSYAGQIITFTTPHIGGSTDVSITGIVQVVADNIRKGAALNAVQLAELVANGG